MKIATHVARCFLGLVFFVFGLNGFLNFIPMPPPEGPSGDFLGAMVKTGYLLQLVKTTEVTCGALLLANRFVPLALVMLAPVLVNITFFHAFLTPPKDMVGPVIFLTVYGFLIWRYRASFAPLFTAKVTPS